MERAEERKLIDFSDPCLSTFLPVLLQDHTTGKNIIWATDPPPELGVGFADEITLEQIKKCPPVPRVLKRLDEQKQRTKARANMLMTWRENFKWLFGIEPDAGKVRNMAAIISWNVWQMDGLKKTVPGTDIPCKIKDWKADKEILFKDVGEDG